MATHPISTFTGTIEQPAGVGLLCTANSAQRRKDSPLLLRFVLVNLLALGLLGGAWWEGLIAKVVAADQVVFMAGLCISALRARQINQEIDQHRTPMELATGKSAPASSQEAPNINAIRLALTHRIASVRYVANVLVLLGLIGTVLGFIIALSGVSPDAARDVEGIAPMVSTLIRGMSTALYTTLVGSVLNIWLMANYQILASGTVELMGLWMLRAEPASELTSTTAHA